MGVPYDVVTDYRGLLTAQGQLVPSNITQTPNQNLPAVDSWLEYVSPEYARDAGRWVFSRDAYTGDILRPQKMPRYLIRKVVGETAEAFDERLRLSDYTPHFGAVVDGLVGMLFSSEADAEFRYGSLGDLKDPATPLGKLSVNADGEGHGYRNLWRLIAADLTAIHKAWVYVDGGPPGGRPVARILAAESVVNERWVNGQLVEALVQEEVDTRASLQDDPRPQLQWVRYTQTGWVRYRRNDKKQPEIVDHGPYQYEDRHGKLALPLFPVRLPLERPVGYLMARKAIIIFNQESTRDHGLRFANFPLLNVHGNDPTFKKIVQSLKDGARVLQNQPGLPPHSFIAPSGEPARILTDVLKRKVEEFWISSFREYGDAAIEKSATEIKQDVASGVGAYLVLLKTAVDEAENELLWRLEQTYYPDDRSKWWTTHVERSDDFVPFDVNATVQRLREKYFGAQAQVPIGREGRLQVAKQIAAYDGLEVNEVEMAAALDTQLFESQAEAVALLYENIPPEVKAELAVRLLIDLGYVKPDKKTDGPQISVAEARKLVTDTAQQASLQKEAQAAAGLFPSGKGGMPSGRDTRNALTFEAGQGAGPGGAQGPNSPAPKPK